jgi:hypothetical protein
MLASKIDNPQFFIMSNCTPVLHTPAGLSGNCIAAWNIAGFAIRHSILESKYVAFGNFTLLFSILYPSYIDFCLFSLFKWQIGEAIPAKPIANCLMFRAELQIRLNGKTLCDDRKRLSSASCSPVSAMDTLMTCICII